MAEFKKGDVVVIIHTDYYSDNLSVGSIGVVKNDRLGAIVDIHTGRAYPNRLFLYDEVEKIGTL